MPVTGKYRTLSQSPWIYLWGEEEQGREFNNLINKKFGTERGARKTAILVLGISRRLMNMYARGQRRVPDDLMKRLRKMPKWNYTIDPLS